MAYLRSIPALLKLPFTWDVMRLQAGTFIYSGVAVASSVIFARVLGINGYGLYATVLAFVGTVTALLNFGQGTALLVFFAEEYGKQSMEGMSRVLRSFIQVSLVNSAVLILIAFVIPIFSEKLYPGSDIARLARILLLYHAVDIGNSMVIIILQAVRKITVKVVLEQSQNITFLVLAVVSLFLGKGIVGIVGSQLLTSILFLPIALTVYTIHRRSLHLPLISTTLRVPFKDTLAVAGQGLLFALEKNIGNLFPNGLFFALSLIAEPAAVGIARIASQAATLPRSFILPQIGGLSLTVLSQLRAQGIKVLRQSALEIVRHAVVLHLIVSAGAMVLFPPLLLILYGSQYRDAISITEWLIVLSIPASFCIVNSPLLRLLRKIHYSIFQAILTWIVLFGIVLGSSAMWTPHVAFTISYGIAYAAPLLLTLYLFFFLLPKKETSQPRAWWIG